MDDKVKAVYAHAEPFGFSIKSCNPSGSYVELIDENGITLEVWPEREKATLSFQAGIFSVEARYFAWPHQGFKEIFLNKARELKKKIERT